MAPIVHGLEQQYAGRIDFIYLDIADPATAPARARFGFRATPHFFVLDSAGSVLQQWQGVRDSAEVDRALRGAL